MSNFTHLISLFIFAAPIEQNVNGEQGFYQLEYTRKSSKMIEEFKSRNGAREIRGETENLELETKVSQRYTDNLTHFYSFGNLSAITLHSMERIN